MVNTKADMQAKPATNSDADFAAIYPLRPLLLAGTVTLLAYSCGVGVVCVVAYALVPPVAFLAWAGTACLFLLSWLAIVVAFWLRQPTPRETVIIWGRASRYITYGSQLIVAWAIWAFFAHLPPTERMMLAGMFLSCSPAQLIAAPENVAANRMGILASNGSLVLWFAWQGSGVDLAMAAFAFCGGVMLFGLCSYVPGTIAGTVAARLAAEDARENLQRALDAVAAERDAKTRFIAAASHDLGQPLQAAGLFFDQTLRAQEPAQRARAAEGVRRAFAAADQLISHMLNHLRLEADAVDPHLSTVTLGPVLTRIAAQFAPAAAEAGATLRVVPGSARIRLDRMLFERALGNLIANAITHSGANRILVGLRRQGATVRIWVIDNGCGIARVDAAHVFDDYYRGSDSRAATKGGFGLGLSSVRRIAHLMQGSAGLDPRWLHGAAFYLEFPAEQQQEVQP